MLQKHCPVAKQRTEAVEQPTTERTETGTTEALSGTGTDSVEAEEEETLIDATGTLGETGTETEASETTGTETGSPGTGMTGRGLADAVDSTDRPTEENNG